MEQGNAGHEFTRKIEHAGKDAGAFSIEQSAESDKGLQIRVIDNLPRKPILNTIDELRKDKYSPVKISANMNRERVSVSFVRGENDTICVTETPAIWQEFRDLRDNPDVPKPTGTAKVLATTEKDGTSKLLLQKRKAFRRFTDAEGNQKQTGNEYYGGIPGASVAGYWNAEWEEYGTDQIKVKDAGTEAAIANIHAEMDHEVFLKPEDLIAPGADRPSTRIVGFVTDKINPHTEVMLYAKANLSAEEIKQRAKESKKNRAKDDFDFDEDYFFIDGTPEAIEKLLTDVKCPLPPTHAAAFEEAGYMMVLQAKGLEAAKAWQNAMIEKIKTNYEAMDKLVQAYYAANPDVYELNKAAVGAKNRVLRNGYDAAFTPEQQGLPGFEAEMLRTGLLQANDIAEQQNA